MPDDSAPIDPALGILVGLLLSAGCWALLGLVYTLARAALFAWLP